jgi:hypothetical protein
VSTTNIRSNLKEGMNEQRVLQMETGLHSAPQGSEGNNGHLETLTKLQQIQTMLPVTHQYSEIFGLSYVTH